MHKGYGTTETLSTARSTRLETLNENRKHIMTQKREKGMLKEMRQRLPHGTEL